MTKPVTVDVFNGDADGICALIQYRLAFPAVSTLVTGVKRDIQLLERVTANAGDQVSVFDISMAKNSDNLQRLLLDGADVFYVDHHLSGDIPKHPKLNAIIDTSPTTCTSLLVNQYLEGKYSEWAITAAFGDNILNSAVTLANTIGLSSNNVKRLKRLGISINYNGYGRKMTDLNFNPSQLYTEMVTYKSPFDFLDDPMSVYSKLQSAYDDDIAKTRTIRPESVKPQSAIYTLPNELWARRVSGVFGNQLANKFPERAHAIFTHDSKGGFVVSVRAPLNNLEHAGDLCSKFTSGGGRKGAAGINHLPESERDKFVSFFEATYN